MPNDSFLYYSVIPIKSIIIPEITPIVYNKVIIPIFSLILLFVLNNTASPTPAPVNKPDIILPSEITFSKYIFVIITDAAQFGINPISDAIIGPITCLFNIQLAIVSSPTKCTTVFIINVIIIINNNILNV